MKKTAERKILIDIPENTKAKFSDVAANIKNQKLFQTKIEAAKKSISYMLYEYLMDAKNARIILLTGTPIINYPNEIAVL